MVFACFSENSVNRRFGDPEKRQPPSLETARTAGGSDRPGATKAPRLSPAPRRRKLHTPQGGFSCSCGAIHLLPRFRPKGRKLAHSAAPPLPSEPAPLGFAGGPILPCPEAPPKIGPNLPRKPPVGRGLWPAPKEATQPLTGCYTGETACCRERRTAAERSGSIPPARTPDAGASSRRTETSGTPHFDTPAPAS